MVSKHLMLVRTEYFGARFFEEDFLKAVVTHHTILRHGEQNYLRRGMALNVVKYSNTGHGYLNTG